jgi:DNA-binding LytR/AlgR family response regulator
MINCIALDDEPLALEVLISLCKKIPFIDLLHTFTSFSKAQQYLNSYPVDLIFLDIEMPDKNGLEFLKTLNLNVMVIFTTAHSKYAVDAFSVNAIDYLLKPIEPDRLMAACLKASSYFEYLNTSISKFQNFLFVRSEYTLIKILHSEIYYLETFDDYIKIHISKGKFILTLMSMTKILEKLPKNEFIRVHRSFAVSISNISSIRSQTIFIGGTKIPIGAKYKKQIQAFYFVNK